MWKTIRDLYPTSFRLNLLITCEVLLLLTLSVAVLLFFSRRSLRQEAFRDAEEVLDGTVQNIENVMQTVVQTVDNFYPDLQRHLDQPDHMVVYSRKIVESNPYISGCAIVFTPNYYKGHELFMAYVRREASSLVEVDRFGSKPYTEQEWFTRPMTTGKAFWSEPTSKADIDTEAFTTFCHPVYNQRGQCVAVVAVDLSVSMLSEVVHLDKSAPNGYSVLLGSDGAFVIHPDAKTLTHQTAITHPDWAADESLQEAVRSMLNGETGYKPFRMDGKGWYVFYEPFTHNRLASHEIEPLRWSVGEVLSDEDIMGNSDTLLYIACILVVVSVLLFYVLCRMMIGYQLRPLRKLTDSARGVAEGHYQELIPNAQRDDEVGQLQDRFQKMQRWLAAHVSELEALKHSMTQQGDMLHKASGQAHETNRVRSAFLHYISAQMLVPGDIIDKSVTTLCNNYHHISVEDAEREVENIKRQNVVILDMLNHIIEAVQIEEGKEVSHD